MRQLFISSLVMATLAPLAFALPVEGEPQPGGSEQAKAGPVSSTDQPAVEFATASQEPFHTEVTEESHRIVREGIAVEFSIGRVDSQQLPAEDSGPLREGDDVRIQFKITDTTTGTPATTLEPAAWLHPAHGGATAQEKVRAFLTGSLSSRAEIDLNVFYVLAMNEDASISVVDPLFGYGGSKLLAMVRLQSPGQDWILNPDQTRLFVTMPEIGQVAVVNTANWKVVENIGAGARPMRIRVQPDGKYLWVGCNGSGKADPTSGVTVIDLVTLEVAEHIATAQGHHEIAFSDDSRYAFVTNQESDTLSVVDIRTLKVVKQIDTGRGPSAVAFSNLSQAAYVVSERDGQIAVVDRRSLEVITRIDGKPGLTSVWFAPHGRHGFAVNPKESLLHVIDVSTHRVVQSGEIGKNPDHVTFTESLAYVRSLGTEQVYMIPLNKVGREGTPIPVIDFTGGHNPFGLTPFPSLAPGIVPAPGGIAVLVANPLDKSIYYYREGMAAPMGEFQNYGRQPRAVLVVDRSLREVEPGLYATEVKLDLRGKVDVPFFLDAPRIVHCFEIEVKPTDSIRKQAPGRAFKIEPLMAQRTIQVGESVTVRFRVTDSNNGQPQKNLRDFGVLVNTPGNWHKRQWARAVGDGIYEIEFTPPRTGTYYISFQCPSLNLRFNESPPLILRGTKEAKEG